MSQWPIVVIVVQKATKSISVQRQATNSKVRRISLVGATNGEFKYALAVYLPSFHKLSDGFELTISPFKQSCDAQI